MVARVYYSHEGPEILGIEAYLRQRGISVEKVPVMGSLNESAFGGAPMPGIRIVINEVSYNSVSDLYRAEQRGELPTLLRG